MEEIQSAFQEIVKFLSDNDIDYVIVGGILTTIYSIPRTTQDIDIIIQIDEDFSQISSILQKMEDEGFIPFNSLDNMIILIKEGSNISFLDRRERIRSSLNRLAFEDRKVWEILGVDCWVQCPEVFIISKLAFQGYQDYIDALGAWKNYKELLDTSRMRDLAAKFRVTHTLGALLSETDPDEVFED